MKVIMDIFELRRKGNTIRDIWGVISVEYDIKICYKTVHNILKRSKINLNRKDEITLKVSELKTEIKQLKRDFLAKEIEHKMLRKEYLYLKYDYHSDFETGDSP